MRQGAQVQWIFQQSEKTGDERERYFQKMTFLTLKATEYEAEYVQGMQFSTVRQRTDPKTNLAVPEKRVFFILDGFIFHKVYSYIVNIFLPVNVSPCVRKPW